MNLMFWFMFKHFKVTVLIARITKEKRRSPVWLRELSLFFSHVYLSQSTLAKI